MASYGAPKRSAASPEPGPYTMTQPMGQICIADGDNHPKYKGVRKRKWGKWVSEVRLPNSRERIWLGSFDTPQKAARAFDAAQFCLRGRCARFNFPDDPPDIPGGESLNPREIQVVAARFANESSTCTADHHHQQQQEDIDRYYHTNYNAIINTNENSSSSWQEPSQNPNHHDQYQPYCHRNVDSSASFITNSAHGDMDWSFLNSIDESGATSANNYDSFDTLFGGQLYGHQMHYYSGNEFCPPPPPVPPGSDSIREDNQINGEQQYSSFLWNF